jgi:hypothetical protein
MMNSRTAKRVSGFAPIVMSLAALALVADGVIQYGNHPPADEGWQAHIFQILMAAQLPIIFAFVGANWRSLRQHLPILAAQVLLWLAALGSVRLFSL